MSDFGTSVSSLWTSFVQQAKAAGKTGDIHGVVELFREKVAKKPDLPAEDRRQIGVIFQRIAGHLFHSADMRAASTAYEEAERYFRENGTSDLLQKALGEHFTALMHIHDIDRATSVAAERVKLCRELDDREGLLSCLGAQIQILQARGDQEHVAELVEQQEELARELGGNDGVAKALMTRALSLVGEEKAEEAQPLIEEAEKLLRSGNDRRALANAIGTRGIVAWKTGDLKLAVQLQQEAGAICREIDDTEGLARAMTMQALALGQQGQMEAALRLLHDADRLARAGGFTGLADELIIPVLASLRETAPAPPSPPPAPAAAPVMTSAPPSRGASSGPSLTMQQTADAARMLTYLRTQLKGFLDAGQFDFVENLARETLPDLRKVADPVAAEAAFGQFLAEVHEARQRAGGSRSPARAAAPSSAPPSPRMDPDVNKAVLMRLTAYPQFVERGNLDRALLCLNEAYELAKSCGQAANAEVAIKPALEKVLAMKGASARIPVLAPDSPVRRYIHELSTWQQMSRLKRLIKRKPQPPAIG